MKLLTEYLERAVQLEALAADESDPVFKSQLLDQAKAYRKIAAKRPRNTACRHQVRPNQISAQSNLLRVESGFLRLQIRDKFFGAVNRNLIQDRPLYVAIPLNRLVDLVALLTHWAPPFQAGEPTGPPVIPITKSRLFGFAN
jgi:hypothetical protein